MTWEYLISLEHLKTVGITIGIFLLFILFRKFFTKYIFKFLLKIGHKGKTALFPNILAAFERPLQWFFIALGLYVSIQYYPHYNRIDEPTFKLLRVFVIFLITWGLLNLASSSSQMFRFINEKTNIKLDDILIPFLSRSLQVIIVAISISVILQEFNYQVGGFLTGVGLGGLAFSLAAQDAIANLFGGVIIITEKPFTINDWITTPSVDGTVEDISFRSTKVRTFAQALVTVPNATLSNEPITNWSKMGKRRVSFNLRITYNTPTNQIRAVVKQINELLKNHSEIHQETIFVTFNKYKENSAEILLYFFTKTTDWGKHLAIKEEINFKIMEILESEDVSIAIPSRRLYSDREVDGKQLPQSIE